MHIYMRERESVKECLQEGERSDEEASNERESL